MTQSATEDAGGKGPDTMPLDRKDVVVGLALGAVALAAYVLTLAPGLLRADSGEFQTLSVTLGYAHPTGYPVYLLLARLATALPFGDVPYRVNLLSALAGALAVVLTYLLCRVVVQRRWVPLAGALALAASPTFWSQAIIAEVYTCGIVAMLGVLLCLALWQRTSRAAWLFVAGCLGGAGLGIHSTHALIAPAVLLFMLTLHRQRWKANWSAATAGAITGVAITVAAFWIVDRADSPCSYFRTVIEPSRSLWQLEPGDMDSFTQRVCLSMNPPQYKGLLFSQSAQATWEETVWYSDNLRYEFPPLWLIAFGAGLVWLGRRNWRMTMLLALAFLSHLFYDLSYNMGGIHVLYLATYLPIVVFGTAGLACADDGCRALLERWRKRKFSPAASDGLASLVGLAVVIWPMLFPGAWNVEHRRHCRVPPEEEPFSVEYSAKFHEDARRLIDDLEQDSVVLTGWCLVYPYYYVAHVEKNRTDLTFIQDHPQIYHHELADSLIQYVDRISAERPVFFVHVEQKGGKDIFPVEEVRRGKETLYRVVPKKRKPDK